jgi:hypothetical protein
MCSDIAVNPARSEKTTVTSFIDSDCDAAASSSRRFRNGRTAVSTADPRVDRCASSAAIAASSSSTSPTIRL